MRVASVGWPVTAFRGTASAQEDPGVTGSARRTVRGKEKLAAAERAVSITVASRDIVSTACEERELEDSVRGTLRLLARSEEAALVL